MGAHRQRQAAAITANATAALATAATAKKVAFGTLGCGTSPRQQPKGYGVRRMRDFSTLHRNRGCCDSDLPWAKLGTPTKCGGYAWSTRKPGVRGGLFGVHL